MDRKVLSLDGQEFDLVKELPKFGEGLDIPVLLGARAKVKARLVAQRVPPEVAAMRRRKLKAEARKKCRPVNPRRWALCAWAIMVTNIPKDMMSRRDLLVLYRLRWQIELLFRAWKKGAKVDKSRSEKPWRILCEVYAKLLGALIQHWITVVGGWEFVNRSMEKAASMIRNHASALLAGLVSGSEEQLCATIDGLVACLRKGCKVNKSKKLRSWQLILSMFSGETDVFY